MGKRITSLSLGKLCQWNNIQRVRQNELRRKLETGSANVQCLLVLVVCEQIGDVVSRVAQGEVAFPPGQNGFKHVLENIFVLTIFLNSGSQQR